MLSLISLSAVAEDKPCWNDPDYEGEYKTSLEGVLRSYLLPMNLDEPSSDADVRFKSKDYRFLQIGSFQMELPGLGDRELICTYGFRYVKGTSDGLEGKEHAVPITKFRQYVKAYNIHMQSLLGVQP